MQNDDDETFFHYDQSDIWSSQVPYSRDGALLNFERNYDDYCSSNTQSRPSTPAATAEIEEQNETDMKPDSEPSKLNRHQLQALIQDARSIARSLHESHKKASLTALKAYLLYKRARDADLRSKSKQVWPAHPDDLKNHYLFSERERSESRERTEPLFPILKCNLSEKKVIDVSGKSGDFRIRTRDFESEADNDEALLADLEVRESQETQASEKCPMSQSIPLYHALRRATASIWRSRVGKGELDPRTSHVIAFRCAEMLEALLDQVLATRKQALKVIKARYPDKSAGIENIASNWEAVSAAMKRLQCQAGIDNELYRLFQSHLQNGLFK